MALDRVERLYPYLAGLPISREAFWYALGYWGHAGDAASEGGVFHPLIEMVKSKLGGSFLCEMISSLAHHIDNGSWGRGIPSPGFPVFFTEPAGVDFIRTKDANQGGEKVKCPDVYLAMEQWLEKGKIEEVLFWNCTAQELPSLLRRFLHPGSSDNVDTPLERCSGNSLDLSAFLTLASRILNFSLDHNLAASGSLVLHNGIWQFAPVEADSIMGKIDLAQQLGYRRFLVVQGQFLGAKKINRVKKHGKMECIPISPSVREAMRHVFCEVCEQYSDAKGLDNAIAQISRDGHEESRDYSTPGVTEKKYSLPEQSPAYNKYVKKYPPNRSHTVGRAVTGNMSRLSGRMASRHSEIGGKTTEIVRINTKGETQVIDAEGTLRLLRDGDVNKEPLTYYAELLANLPTSERYYGILENLKQISKSATGARHHDALLFLGLVYRQGDEFGGVSDIKASSKMFQQAIEIAEKTDASAILELCHNYIYYGDSILPNGVICAYLEGLAADIPEATNMLGALYALGVGVKADYGKAKKYFQIGVKKGFAPSLCNMAHLYYYGFGCEVNVGKSFDLYKKSANLGDPYGMFMVGRYYYFGRNVKQDIDKAIKWYTKAADKNHLPAMVEVAHCLVRENKDIDKARTYLERAIAAARTSSPEAYLRMAEYHLAGVFGKVDEKKAFEFMEDAADMGYLRAKYELAEYYRKGVGVKKNPQKFIMTLEEAAEKGHPAAMNRIGVRCYYDRVLLQAFAWFEKAASLGDGAAQINLGLMHYNKSIEVHDSLEAVRNFRLAADKDYATACLYLANCYRTGYAVKCDLKEAHRLFGVALEKFRKGAREENLITRFCGIKTRLRQQQCRFQLFLEGFRKKT